MRNAKLACATASALVPGILLVALPAGAEVTPSPSLRTMTNIELPRHPVELEKGVGIPLTTLPPPTPPNVPVLSSSPGTEG